MKNIVVFFSFYFYPDLSAGSFRSEALSKQLSNKFGTSDEVHVVTTYPNRYSSFNKKVDALEINGNLFIHRIKTPKHNNRMISQMISFSIFAFHASRLIKKIKPNFLLGTSSRLMTALLTFISARIFGVRYFIDLRDIFSESISNLIAQKNSFFGKITQCIFIFLEKKVLNNAAGVNLVSKGFFEYFQKLGLNTSKWHFFPNGVDKDFFCFNKSNLKEKSQIKTILYAGNIGSGQGLEKIIPDLAKSLKKDYRFVIVGDGSTRNLLNDLIINENIENVELHLPVERFELIEFYKEADLLFLHLNDFPAFKRVLPSKLFEYAAVGKPIVAGVAGYSRKFIKNNLDFAFTFSPGNTEEALNSVFDAVECKPLESSVNNFIEKYSREAIMNEMSETLFQLINSKQ